MPEQRLYPADCTCTLRSPAIDRLPDRYNYALDSLKEHTKTSRSIGAAFMLLAMVLLLLAVQQTDPDR